MSFGRIAAVAAVLAGAASPLAAQDDFRWNGRVSEVRVQGIAGGVRAEVASGDRVEVVARRTGRDAREVRVEAVERNGAVTICAVYPGTQGGDGPCRGGGERRGERQGERRSVDARVEFTVRVPAGVRLEVGIVEGDVEAVGLRSPVEVATVSGDVRIATTGTARANTVNGDIDATFRAGDRGTRFNSVNGDVTLRLAGNAGARVSASTLSGEIESDFPLERADRGGRGWVNVQVGSRATATVGRGGAEIGINTVSGDIRIVRAR